MVRRIIEEIEELHSATSGNKQRQSGAKRSLLVEKALADCLQELRANVAADAIDRVQRRPVLRIV
jgi:hypothetical protein